MVGYDTLGRKYHIIERESCKKERKNVHDEYFGLRTPRHLKNHFLRPKLLYLYVVLCLCTQQPGGMGAGSDESVQTVGWHADRAYHAILDGMWTDKSASTRCLKPASTLSTLSTIDKEGQHSLVCSIMHSCLARVFIAARCMANLVVCDHRAPLPRRNRRRGQ